MAKLRQESRQKQISLNTLVNQVTKQHTDWHSGAAEAGLISVRRRLIVRLLEKYNEVEIKSLAADIARDANRDFISLLRREYNIKSALDLIETWIRISGYSYRHETSNDSIKRFFVQHDMGRRWSLYLAELYRNLFEEFSISDFHFDVTDNTVAFTVNTTEGRITDKSG